MNDVNDLRHRGNANESEWRDGCHAGILFQREEGA